MEVNYDVETIIKMCSKHNNTGINPSTYFNGKPLKFMHLNAKLTTQLCTMHFYLYIDLNEGQLCSKHNTTMKQYHICV